MLLFAAVCTASALAGVAWIAASPRKSAPRNWWWSVGFLWVPLTAGFLLVTFDQQPPQRSDFECVLPGEDSGWGPSTWQLWPPGTVCYDDKGNVTSRPDEVTGFIVVVVSGGAAVFIMAGAVGLGRRLSS